MFGNLPIELPHCGHASVSAAGVRTASLDRLQVRPEVRRDVICDGSLPSPGSVITLPAVRVSLTSVQSSVTGGAEVEDLLVLEASLVFSCRWKYNEKQPASQHSQSGWAGSSLQQF